MSFHPQLKRLWSINSFLAERAEKQFPDYETAVRGLHGGPFSNANTKSYKEIVAEKHRYFNQKWMPLVTEEMHLSCSVDILFLRPGSRGHVLNVGDLDGRLKKTLFDALAIPKNDSGIRSHIESEDMIYVLLQDDRFISRVNVESDELLQPTGEGHLKNDARVVITVDIRPTAPNWLTMGFAGL